MQTSQDTIQQKTKKIFCTTINWLNSKGNTQGFLFSILITFSSCINDVITKLMGQRLNPWVIIFFRFFFTLITLLPFTIKNRKAIYSTQNYRLHFLRGTLGFFSFAAFIFSIITLPLSQVVALCWTIPLFNVLFSRLWLHENVSFERWVATLIGFVGSLVIIASENSLTISCTIISLLPLLSAMLFSVQDVIIKHMVAKEKFFTMLIYFAIITSVLSAIPAIYFWQTPTLNELFFLFLLGCGSNLIQFFIFKAYDASDLSFLAPFRYIEFIVAAILAYIFFGEIPNNNIFIGALILVFSTLYLIYSNLNLKRKKGN